MPEEKQVSPHVPQNAPYDPAHRADERAVPLHTHSSDCGLCRIEISHVSVNAGADALVHDVTAHIHCGQLTALIGPNGAGKTTLIRALLEQVPHSGTVRHVDSLGKALRGVRTGYVPQQLPFDRQMPLCVRDVLAASITRRPVWLGVSRTVREKVEDALALAQAAHLKDKLLGGLSGGELQRMLLALALTPFPDLLILDEPVSGVDQAGLETFLQTIDHLKESRHMAILLVSHDWGLVREHADQVILLNRTVLSSGSAEEVFAGEAFRRAFGDAERGSV